MIRVQHVVSGAAAAAVLSAGSWVLAQGADRSGDAKIPNEITYPEPHYYIDPAGNDSASGKSETEAWASLAPMRSVKSGTVYLKKGGSWTGTLSVSGITISSYGTGDRPIVNGAATMQTKGILEGVKVDGKGRIGITISGSNNIVHDCEIDGRSGTFELGFGVMGTGNLIVGNTVHHLSAMSGDSGDMNTSGGSEAYMIMGSFNEIAYNSASEAHGINKTLGGEEGGCYEIVNGKADSTIENVYFHHNYCERSIGLWEGCSGNFQGTDKIQEHHGIIKNVVLAYNLSVDAMWLYLLQPVNTDFENVVFEHNTLVHTPANHADFVQAARDSFGLQVTSDQGYTSEPLKPGAIIVRNNIFWVTKGATTGSFMGTLPASDHYNNLFANMNPGWTLGEGEKKVDDPGLTADYRLAAGSPAIDAASAKSWQLWTDYDGNTVPTGSAPDIGISELCAGADCRAAAPIPGTGGGATGGGAGTGVQAGGASNAAAGGSSGQAGSTGRTRGSGGAAAGAAGVRSGAGLGGGTSAEPQGQAGQQGGANASSASGDHASPGAGGSAVTGGTGGASTGASRTGGEASGAAGAAGPTGSAGASGGALDKPAGEGCTCRTASQSRYHGAAAFLGLVAFSLVRRRGGRGRSPAARDARST